MRVEGRYYRGVVSEGHRTGSTAVEAPVESNHPVLARVEGSQLHRVLVGFGSAVVKEKEVIFIARHFPQFVGKLLLEGIHHAVGIESYLVHLVGQRLDIGRMRMTYGDDSVATVEVKVPGTFVIPDPAAGCRGGDDVEKGINIE